MFETFHRVKTENNELRQVQDSVASVFAKLTDKIVIDGLHQTGIDIISGTQKIVNHGLGRDLKGWFITLRNANAVVWDSQATNKTPSRTLILNASANVTVDLWVF